ncbi:MAG: ABC transporter permease subunit [Thermomicrobiaceae bacterium]
MSSDSAPIFWLTARQFLEGRSIRVVAALAAVPLLLGLIELIASGSDVDPRNMLGQSFNELSIPTLLPLIALILGSSALGNEISDRTLPYLVLKPWSRMRIIQEKFLATIVIGSIISIVFGFLVWGILCAAAGEFDGGLLLAVIVASVLAIAAYGAAFTFLSLMITRVLMAGLLYVLIWESLLARFIPGLRLLSIRHYVQSLFAHILGDATVTVEQQAAVGTSLIVLLAVTLVFIVLSWLRLQQMDLD